MIQLPLQPTTTLLQPNQSVRQLQSRTLWAIGWGVRCLAPNALFPRQLQRWLKENKGCPQLSPSCKRPSRRSCSPLCNCLLSQYANNLRPSPCCQNANDFHFVVHAQTTENMDKDSRVFEGDSRRLWGEYATLVMKGAPLRGERRRG